MESPYNHPVAAELIGKILAGIERRYIEQPDWCGLSHQMEIYTELKRAGYLTDKAMIPCNFCPNPYADHTPILCCDRSDILDPCL